VQLAQWGILVLSAAVFILAATWGSRGRWLEIATWLFLAVGTIVVLELYLPPLRDVFGWSSPTMANRSMFWTWLAAMGAGQVIFNRRLKPMLRIGLVIVLVAAGYVLWFHLDNWLSGWAPFSLTVLVVLGMWVWRRSRFSALVLLLVLLAISVIAYPVLFAHVGGEQELARSWGGREKLYMATLDLVKEHPILGLGPVAYREYGLRRWLSLGYGRALYLQPRISSHNNYLDVYAQQGLVGLGIFLWFLVELGVLGWRLRTRFQDDFHGGYVHGAIAGFIGTLAAMMLADWFLPFVYNIGFPGFRTSVLAWMFLGGLVALETVACRRKSS
jgi:O-antigen ligase